MYKSKLQVICHKQSWTLPQYSSHKDGPHHRPRFTATVTVNDVTFETPTEFGTSKEAQNEAAKVAVNHFSTLLSVQQQSPNITPLPEHQSSGFSASTTNFEIEAGKSGRVEQKGLNGLLSAETPIRLGEGSSASTTNFDIEAGKSRRVEQKGLNGLLFAETPIRLGEGSSASTTNFDIEAGKSGRVEQKGLNGLLFAETPIRLGEGSSASTTNLDIKAAKSGQVEQKGLNSLLVAETPKRFGKDLLHLYKNRLQEYAQKRNLILPTYSCEIAGPPHDRRFKSRITLDGKSFETPVFYTTLKDAENAAAKVAFESMALHETQEDEGLYKNLLQELARRNGICFPTYETEKSGPPHVPIFISTVKIGGDSFQGQMAKTKKLAEMNAAKAAYIYLAECQERGSSSVTRTSEVSSFNLQPDVTEKVEEAVAIESNISIEEQAEEIKDGKWHRNSSLSAHVRERGSSLAAKGPREDPKELNIVIPSGQQIPPEDPKELNIVIPSGQQISDIKRILVCPRTSNMTIPKGATMLPISDDQWVAMGLQAEKNSN